MAKRVSILGATGSIGQSACDVIASDPERFDVQVVTAHSNGEKLEELAQKVGAKKTILGGEAEQIEAAQEPADLILNAIVGFTGLKPLMAAIEQGTTVAIANKEPLVAAGPLVIEAAEKHGTAILPVDSEHNAIFQVFDPAQKDQIKRIILTASGGPFLRRDDVSAVTPEEAVKHPNWNMGAKISVDSATMMNKALEVIEAHYLFDLPANQIDVMIHPQSVVHSMVEYADGSVLSQMGASDMRTPIANVLAYPERMATPGETLDLTQMRDLTFEKPNLDQFPALRLAYECLDRGLSACVALNAANEVMVDAFLSSQIGFSAIIEGIESTLANVVDKDLKTLDDIIAFDHNVREQAGQYINGNTTQKAV